MLKTFAKKEKSVERPAFLFSKTTGFKLYFLLKGCAEIQLSLTLLQNSST